MRRHYLDRLRCSTVLIVVIYHVFYIYNGLTPGVLGPLSERQPQDAVQYLLYPWMMVLLFLIAGASARYSLDKRGAKAFFRERTRRLLVPSTLGVLAFGWIQGWISMAISQAFASIPDTVPGPVYFLIMTASGISVLWFAQVLWLCSALAALLRRCEKGRLYELCGRLGPAAVLLLGVPLWLSGLVLNTPVITVYRFGLYGFAFLLGYFVFAHKEVIARLVPLRVPLALAAAALGAYYTATRFGENYAVAPASNCLPAMAYGWIMCLALFAWAKKYWDSPTALSAWLAKRSFGLYVLHYLPLSAAAYALRTYTSVPALPCYLLTALAAFGGALLLNALVSRVPLVRWLVLGIGKEQK